VDFVKNPARKGSFRIFNKIHYAINNGWCAKQMKVNQSTRRVSTGDDDEEAGVALPPNPSKTIWR
jgi:hypothetical protein